MSVSSGRIIIIGAGQAGLQTAEALRSGGYAGEIVMLGDEAYGPYHRPPLSKAWLAGEMEAAQLMMRAPELLAKKNIELRTGTKVNAIDNAGKMVRLSDDSELSFSGLVLATGSTPRILNIPGANAKHVLALRTRDDASAIMQALLHCAKSKLPLVVIGGGFIGLEVAATARKRGLQVTVLEASPRLLGRVLAPVLSEWYAALHRSHGVQIEFNVTLKEIEQKNGAVCAVLTQEGKRYPAGMVLVGIGVEANDMLARDAGIACDRGVIVDDCSRTSMEGIVAAGDCTARRIADGSLLRLESVQNATEQGKSAAAALLGQSRPFTATPWFWSDQYDKKLQMAGLSMGSNAWAVRGSMESGVFSVFHFRDGKLVAVDSVNDSKIHLLSRKLLDAGALPSPDQAADTAFDLNSLLAK